MWCGVASSWFNASSPSVVPILNFLCLLSYELELWSVWLAELLQQRISETGVQLLLTYNSTWSFWKELDIKAFKCELGPMRRKDADYCEDQLRSTKRLQSQVLPGIASWAAGSGAAWSAGVARTMTASVRGMTSACPPSLLHYILTCLIQWKVFLSHTWRLWSVRKLRSVRGEKWEVRTIKT